MQSRPLMLSQNTSLSLVHVTSYWDPSSALLAVEINRENRGCIDRTVHEIELLTCDNTGGLFGILYLVTIA